MAVVVVAVLAVLLIAGHAEGGSQYWTDHWDKSGVRLTASQRLDVTLGYSYSGYSVTQSSRVMEGLKARNRGQQNCDAGLFTDWDTTVWRYGTQSATAMGSGPIYPIDQCPYLPTHVVLDDGWYEWHNWTQSPLINYKYGYYRISSWVY
jgi:hypothetical protein